MSDIAWASGLIDGEGWIGWGTNQNGVMTASIRVVNTEKELLEVLLATFGVGSLRARTKYPKQNQAWVWAVYGANAWAVLECVQSYLQSPRKQEKLQAMIGWDCLPL